ncbi:M48 family metallopeptidase [Haloarchaeobius sp. DFWS5]|uniref:M48 family metallopeptidase n=1 Tax=Haloarchaeobius sp. DFWS5 TaxID=3446114 RepID=UPI003EBC77D6
MPSNGLGLRFRMLVALVGLVLTTVALAGVLSGVLALALMFVAGVFGPIPDPLVTLGITVPATLALFGWSTRRELRSSPVDAVDAPESPVPDELDRLVTATSQQLDVPVPDIRLVDIETPLAMVTGVRRRDATLALSTGVLDCLDDDELAAVVAHELAHVANRDATITSLCAVPVFVADDLFTYGMDELGDPEVSKNDRNGLEGIVVALSVFIGGVFLAVGRGLLILFSRQRELVADQTAVSLTGNPGALASALATLDERFAGAPTVDVRAADGVEAFSIVPPPPEDPEPSVMLGPDGNRKPQGWWYRRLLIKLKNRLPGTHPATTVRIERLREGQ